MVELPPLDAPLDDVLELARVVAGGGLVRHVKVGLDDIAHVPQQQGGPLLDIVRGTQVQLPLAPFHHCPGRAGGDGGFYLVAPKIGEADGGAHVNPVDDPPQTGMPVDGLHQSPGRRRGHHVVAHPFHFHLRPCKQGVIPPDLQRDRHRRSLLSVSFTNIGEGERQTAP